MKLKLVNAKGATISMSAKHIKLEGARMTVSLTEGRTVYLALSGVDKVWWFSDIEGGEFVGWSVES